MNAGVGITVTRDDGAGLSPRERFRSCLWLTLFAAVLMLGFLMEADPEHAVLFGFEGPHCLVRRFAGEDACPGCGLTRSVILCLHGEWHKAWAAHPAGILAVALSIGGVLVHGNILVGGRRTDRHGRISTWGYRLFAAGLVLSWLYRLLF